MQLVLSLPASVIQAPEADGFPARDPIWCPQNHTSKGCPNPVDWKRPTGASHVQSFPETQARESAGWVPPWPRGLWD